MDRAVLLFTDLAAADVDDDAEEQLRRAHFRLVRMLAPELAPRNLGDGLLLAFDDPASAIRFARDLTGAAARRGRRDRGLPIAPRIAVHEGGAIRDEEDYLSTAVCTTRKLCAAAAPGTVLVSRRVAEQVDGLRSADARPFSLAGRGRTVEAVELPPPAAPVFPMPPEVVAPDPLVGRASELEWLTSHWARAASGARSVVLVSGAVGAGVTSVISAAARTARDAGAIVLYGRPDRFAVVPFGAPHRALAGYLRASADHVLRDHLSAGRGARALFPSLPWPDEDADVTVPAALAALVRDVAYEAPVLLVLDDLDRADEGTILTLRALDDLPSDAELCVVAAFATDRLRHDSPVVAALGQLGAERLRVGALDAAALSELLSHADAQHEGGSALLAAELSRHAGHGRLPESLAEAVGRRLEMLSPPARRVAAAAAVLGAEPDDVLARVAQSGPDAIAEAREAGFVDGVHDAIARTVLEELDATDRLGTHRRAAQSLQDVADDPADVPGARALRVAAHLLMSGDRAAASAWTARAVECAPALHGAAARNTAVELPVVATVAPKVETRREPAVEPRREPPGAADEPAPGPVERRSRALERATAMFSAFPFRLGSREARAEADAVAALADPSLAPVEHALRVLVGVLDGRPVRDADTEGQPAAVATLSGIASGWSQFAAGRVADGLAALDSAWACADKADLAPQAMAAARACAHARLGVLDVGGARAALVRELGKPRMRGGVHRRPLLDDLSVAEALSGRRQDALRAFTQADVEGPRAAAPGLLAFYDGDLARAEAILRRERDERADRGTLPAWHADRLLSRVLRAGGEADASRGVLEQTLAALLRAAVVPGELAVRAELAVVASSCGDQKAARSHLIRCVEITAPGGEWYGVGARVGVAQALVELASGRREQARARFDAAADALRRFTLPFEEADALSLWSRALHAAGLRGQASERMTAAVDSLRSIGAGEPWLSRVTASASRA